MAGWLAGGSAIAKLTNDRGGCIRKGEAKGCRKEPKIQFERYCCSWTGCVAIVASFGAALLFPAWKRVVCSQIREVGGLKSSPPKSSFRLGNLPQIGGSSLTFSEIPLLCTLAWQ